MRKFGLIYRVKLVFEVIGKPIYWLFISPLLFFSIVSQFLRTSFHSQKKKAVKKHKDITVYKRKKRKSPPSFVTLKKALFYGVFIVTLIASTIENSTLLVRTRLMYVGRATHAVCRFILRPRFLFTFLFIIILSSLFTASYWFYSTILKDLPSPKDLIAHQPNLTTKIYDRNHVLLYKIYKNENRTLVPLTDLPHHLIEATIAIEDRDFYTHGGLSLRGIFRAFFADIEHDQTQGGSTITQQLVKNTLLTSQKTLTRKIKEMILALEVEAVLTKNQILEMYLNEVSYGGSAYGVEEAAQQYFGIPAKNLDLAQSAFIAGLPAAPSIYSPYSPDPTLGIQRQREVLKHMVEDHRISSSQEKQALDERLVFRPNTETILAPHFVMYAKTLLAQEFGEDELSQGGLEVITSLDLRVQNEAQTAIENEIGKLRQLHVTNGAALVTNPKSGEILAMVGSKNYFDSLDQGEVNVTLRPRQPGSSIKPVTYATALEHGYTPATIIEDSPVTYTIAGTPPWTPRNYDGKFHGNVTVRTALANSYNVPAVKTLASVGIPNMVKTAQSLGITTWDDPSRYGLTLTLGSNEVLMTDMARVYGTFSNLGVSVPLNPILEVRNFQGDILYQNPCKDTQDPCLGTRTLSSDVAYQVTNILSDNSARAPAFGLHSVLTIPDQMVAVKTGTTNNLRDNWTIGYTTTRLVATWVGNNDNTPMSSVTSGITGASPIWNTIMRQLLDPNHPHIFHIPSELATARICRFTGQTCLGGCSDTITEYFIRGTVPVSACTVTPSNAAIPLSMNQLRP